MQRKIYDRIHEDLLSFNRQLEMSRSVQKRLIALRQNVHELSTEFNDPEASDKYSAPISANTLIESIARYLTQSFPHHEDAFYFSPTRASCQYPESMPPTPGAV